jgi:hypothetical protein
VYLSFSIPAKPAGSIFHLSVDHGRLLGRTVRAGKGLSLCIDRLPPGRHLLGYELAAPDQIVRTEERFLPVNIPPGVPGPDCLSSGKRS